MEFTIDCLHRGQASKHPMRQIPRAGKMGGGLLERRTADAWCRTAWKTVKRCAERRGIYGEEAEDCALEFVGRFLDKHDQDDLLTAPEFWSPPWLYRCAWNHTTDFLRRHIRTRHRETDRFASASSDNSETEVDQADESPGPDALLLKSVCEAQIHSALRELSTAQRDMFLRHHVRGETILKIAESMGKSEHAVEQGLLRSRRRLRSVLARKGWEEIDVRRCLTVSRLLPG